MVRINWKERGGACLPFWKDQGHIPLEWADERKRGPLFFCLGVEGEREGPRPLSCALKTLRGCQELVLQLPAL